ncbi:hypothetical protein LWI29_026556 [Acer saccharum]|uniref:Uncharacterized protein n=1 Tax=Acer saccharum TaxID=4024 RepID=A0AA39RJ62_ACESA|nr:hypothetical protein LWI29_026556 [Acer saccharum]
MFHISYGSYRVLEIDYAYNFLTLHEPHMSTCDTMVLSGQGNGFALDDWRSPYFNPTSDNVFFSSVAPPRRRFFRVFPGSVCRVETFRVWVVKNITGARLGVLWAENGAGSTVYGSGPPSVAPSVARVSGLMGFGSSIRSKMSFVERVRPLVARAGMAVMV